MTRKIGRCFLVQHPLAAVLIGAPISFNILHDVFGLFRAPFIDNTWPVNTVDILTSTLLHVNTMHLLMNVCVVSIVVVLLKRVVSTRWLITVVLSSAVLGKLLFPFVYTANEMGSLRGMSEIKYALFSFGFAVSLAPDARGEIRDLVGSTRNLAIVTSALGGIAVLFPIVMLVSGIEFAWLFGNKQVAHRIHLIGSIVGLSWGLIFAWRR